MISLDRIYIMICIIIILKMTHLQQERYDECSTIYFDLFTTEQASCWLILVTWSLFNLHVLLLQTNHKH